MPDIVKTVFHDHAVADFEFHLSRPYRSRAYCVQYRETDLDFVARLLADEGIYWHVRHAEGRHTLALQDAHSAHSPAPGCEALPYVADAKAVLPDPECISTWDFSRGIRPGRFELTSYDFERPRADLRADRAEARSHELADQERFDFQGDYTQADDGCELAVIRLEEEQARHERLSGSGTAHGLAVGQLFGLQRHPREDQNRQYLCVSTLIKVESEGAEAGKAPGGFSCKFTAIPANRQFRPPFGRGKPSMRGPQTAVVTGPAGQEIHADPHGQADKQVEALRAQMSGVETRERQAALAHAESIARLEARCGPAVSAEQGLRQSAQSLEQELRSMREPLLTAQQNDRSVLEAAGVQAAPRMGRQ